MAVKTAFDALNKTSIDGSDKKALRKGFGSKISSVEKIVDFVIVGF